MSTSKTESLRRFNLERYLILGLGFTADEAAALRRISRTLRRWHELECGTESGVIERDEATGKPYWINYTRRYLGANDARMRSPVADREAGALRRLARIIKARNDRMPPLSVVMLRDRAAPDTLETYIQTDPRGAALYILRPGDVPTGSKAESCYTNGICVY